MKFILDKSKTYKDTQYYYIKQDQFYSGMELEINRITKKYVFILHVSWIEPETLQQIIEESKKFVEELFLLEAFE